MSENWETVCQLDDLVVDRGAAVLVDGRQVALFRLDGDEVRAVSHRDPYTGANVMARGLVGSRGDHITVASPLHKQVYDLRTGACIDEFDGTLDTWDVRLRDGIVCLRARHPGQ